MSKVLSNLSFAVTNIYTRTATIQYSIVMTPHPTKNSADRATPPSGNKTESAGWRVPLLVTLSLKELKG